MTNYNNSIWGTSALIFLLVVMNHYACLQKSTLVHQSLPSTLMTTSQFAKKENALAAINGGFFNMDNGGSATYLEAQDSVYRRNIPQGKKWAIADWAKTGAVIIKKNGQLKIEAAQSPSFF